MNIIASLSTIIAVLSVITSYYTVYRVKKQISEITDALVDVKNGNGNRRILSATNELTAPIVFEINEIWLPMKTDFLLLGIQRKQIAVL